MGDAGGLGEIVGRHGLRDRLDNLASWWHTDADLGRTIETFTDMGSSGGRLPRTTATPSRRSSTCSRLCAERIMPLIAE